MKEILFTAIASFFGGGAIVAIIGFFTERWKFKAQREATKEDRAAENADKTKEIDKAVQEFQKQEACINAEIDERLKKLETESTAQSEALKVILLDRILYLGRSYINKGYISFDDRKRLRDMHDVYHSGLHGNGDADLVMEGVDALPLE